MLVPDPELPEGERAKILDFGIAKLAGDGGAEALKVKTKTGAMMGTPTYMSPEQCRGIGTIDGRTDVYALGVILFELLAGRTPFVSDGLGELIGMHMFQPPPDLKTFAPKTPPALLQLVACMLAKSPGDRPSMAEAAAALTRIGRSVSQSGLAMPVLKAKSAPPDAAATTANTTFGDSVGQSTVVAKPPRRRPLGLVAGAVGVVLLAGSGVLWTQLHESRVPSGPAASAIQRPDPAASAAANAGASRPGDRRVSRRRPPQSAGRFAAAGCHLPGCAPDCSGSARRRDDDRRALSVLIQARSLRRCGHCLHGGSQQ